MKSSIILFTGLLGLLLGHATWQHGANTSATEPLPISGQARTMDQIQGRWHSFPSGLLLQIDTDGSAQFGQELGGAPMGYGAELVFRGQQLHIRFTGYTGSEESCKTAIGRYTVGMHERGAILFEPVQDDCEMRLELLSGQSEAGMLYHPVEAG